MTKRIQLRILQFNCLVQGCVVRIELAAEVVVVVMDKRDGGVAVGLEKACAGPEYVCTIVQYCGRHK